MTRTSAIFGVVSVLTAAIVGGVFIRKKIIDDALYWKAWALFEENKRRRIRSVEEDINTLNSSIKKEIKNKEDANKNIEKYKKDIEELEEEIKKYEEKITKLSIHTISHEKAKKIDNAIEMPRQLEIKVKKIELKKQIIFLNDRILKLKKIISNKKIILGNYVDSKKRSHFQLKIQINKKNEKTKQKIESEQKLNENTKLFEKIKNLIEELKYSLNQKNNELSIIKSQTFK